ncbi:RHS repeat-associated core domain-containing protein [Chryseobacterium sp. MEBOG06]|uniref:RHS repeat-associated core domain-containing protein n=1 Tax=Chryseobacterium sp. MEBOG06 TaxID=2879938 RepID=UPI00293E79BD|nr:RHS repeat-associated core domain-containing protein [Chryseobacterium sp. MEBOG06]
MVVIITKPLLLSGGFVYEKLYIHSENNKYIYQYKDHLGNARVSFAKDKTSVLEITDINNYYAFGMNHIGGVKGLLGGYMNYKYNGKELQETGMYDYGARMYMPDIGRWGVVDPLSEKGHNFSPYNYAINNPVRFIDPDGMWISITDGQNTYRYSNGQTQHQVDGKWVTIDKNVKLSDNVIGIVSGLSALENGGDTGKDLVSYFDNDKHDVNIMYDKGNAGDAGISSSDPIKIDPKKSTQTPTTNGLTESPFFVSLGHELGHKRDESNYLFNGSWFGVSRGEIFASHWENMIRAENGLPLRSSYSTNPKIFGGLDLQTVLIDCTGNSLYYNHYGKPLDNTSGDDRLNAARSVYGTAASSVLKGRYNYYDNAKRTKKK